MLVSELYQTFGLAKRALALDKNNNGVSIRSPEAVSFCVVGAITKCYSEDNKWHGIVVRLSTMVAEKFGEKSLSDYNNRAETTKQDIINLCLEAKI